MYFLHSSIITFTIVSLQKNRIEQNRLKKLALAKRSRYTHTNFKGLVHYTRLVVTLYITCIELISDAGYGFESMTTHERLSNELVWAQGIILLL